MQHGIHAMTMIMNPSPSRGGRRCSHRVTRHCDAAAAQTKQHQWINTEHMNRFGLHGSGSIHDRTPEALVHCRQFICVDSTIRRELLDESCRQTHVETIMHGKHSIIISEIKHWKALRVTHTKHNAPALRKGLGCEGKLVSQPLSKFHTKHHGR